MDASGIDDHTGPGRRGRARAIERRNHHRVAARLDATLLFNSTGEVVRSVVVNLGLGGARVDLPLEATLPGSVTLQLPALAGPPATSPIEIPAQLAWTVTDREGGPYPTGLQFTKLDEKVRSRLDDYLTVLGS